MSTERIVRLPVDMARLLRLYEQRARFSSGQAFGADNEVYVASGLMLMLLDHDGDHKGNKL